MLDLLIEHKTSKEISRLLGISPHTVDQRIMLARAKLGVASRNEIAQAYRRLKGIYEQSVYQESPVANLPARVDELRREDEEAGFQLVTTLGITPGGQPKPDVYFHVLPEIFDGPYGTLMRLGYIAAITIFLILIILGGLAMFAQVSTMFQR
ncbi:helix-turn-helix transcriptional regulator [Novosphingobium lentum]|uniref:helix-turn-helix transcriptional regulator n=1 Tax=Novosphingobium lentum TaxID=145287 RepID=UPI001FDF4911